MKFRVTAGWLVALLAFAIEAGSRMGLPTGGQMGTLARKGFYVESTSAAAAAGLTQLLASGAIKPNESTVLVLTGTGLKASEKIGELLKLQAREM